MSRLVLLRRWTALLSFGVLAWALAESLRAGQTESQDSPKKADSKVETKADVKAEEKGEPKPSEERKSILPLRKKAKKAEPPPPPEPVAKPGEKVVAKSEWEYQGAETCKSCHSEKKQITPDQRAEPWFKLDEYPVWANEDKHVKAFAILKEPRSQQMGKILGWDVVNDERCLRCHSMKGDRFPIKEGTVVTADKFNPADGVSCDGCHGPSKKWIGDHATQRDKWFGMKGSEKQELGFRDVRDPVKRSQMCFSCHIGDSDQGRVLTHEMYAAGHPPLPGIEVVFFSENMPRHWTLYSEKQKKLQDTIAASLNFDQGTQDRSRMMLIGAVVALKQSMDLVAKECQPNKAPIAANDNRDWPDLTHFDCAACHHDLILPSWRQNLGYPGNPGWPRNKNWPIVLVRLGIRFLGEPETDFRGQINKLANALAIRPFGEPTEIAKVAEATSKWCDEQIARLKLAKFDGPQIEKLIETLASLGVDPEAAPDFDSARQLGWALWVLASDRAEDAKNQKELEVAIDRDLTPLLKLDLPTGKTKEIMKELGKTLDTQAEFKPEEFRKIMSGLRERHKTADLGRRVIR